VFHIVSPGVLNIILPVGISFYTFQSLSYLIDVYRGRVEPDDSFLKISLYISFFPQLVAGPIVRSEDFLPQLNEKKELTADNFCVGIQIFIMGWFKKAVIADRLAVCVDSVFAAPTAFSSAAIWCAAISYAMQIYCDFSGYSDMAIGISRVLGYNLVQNFALPYMSKNPTEFWRRWHISLSSWLKDYLYIPLGGNRKGRYRTYVNLFFTMLLGGLWHGASWNFVIWGGLHGAALIAHKIFIHGKEKYNLHIKNSIAKAVICSISILANDLFVTICWIFFRLQNLSNVKAVLHRMFCYTEGIKYIYVYAVIFAVMLGFIHVWAMIFNRGYGKYIILDLNSFWNKVLLFCSIWIIFAFGYSGETAFIYFQF